MICHIDADSFFASVLQRKHPRLRGKPLLALGMGGGCVIAASYEAKAKGVKTGMPLRDALALCPQAERMSSDFAETALASHQIESIIQNHCPVIEQMSIDEWFLDLDTLVGGVPFDLFLWAKDIQKEIMTMTGLSVSVGVGPSKLLAKMASEYRKPAGVTVVEKHTIETFLADRPAAAIPGIGRMRELHTKARHWDTAWDIATADTATLQKLFGKQGPELQQELLGECLFEVNAESAQPQSISRTRSFKALKGSDVVWAHVLQHVSYCVLKMRKQKLCTRGISVWLRDNKYEHSGLQLKLPQPFDTEEAITPYVRKLFLQLFDKHTLYTQAGFALWNLHERASKQFSLFRDANDMIEEETLQQSLDELRIKYGREVVIRGSALPVHDPHKRKLDLPMFE
ncbi:MAG TPA: DNA polymerase IV [Candidatus Peribacteraceae bacterium]|nr:DNA polymerase IV [Candidatus Peribacteraceae bacterium]